MTLINTLLYPPVTMALSGIAFMWLVAIPDRPVASWRIWVGCVAVLAGVSYYFISLLSAIEAARQIALHAGH